MVLKDLPQITVCVCTLQRPRALRRLLADLAGQKTQNLFKISIVVADNDSAESARPIVDHCRATLPLTIDYVVEPRRSISYARNKSLEPAQGNYIAFVDDDEYPAQDWLLRLYLALTEHRVAGVFGPVRPSYDSTTPFWIIKGGFYERPEHPTGFPMPWRECRTGNVLVEHAVLKAANPVFRAQFGGGASDMDLFRRLIELGHQFIWCNEAVVFETVPAGRCKRRFLIRRAFLRGRISLKHPEGRVVGVIKALLAVPVYTLALPFLQLAGHHLFMRYLVKVCDHLGRLLALFGLNPVHTRDMQ